MMAATFHNDFPGVFHVEVNGSKKWILHNLSKTRLLYLASCMLGAGVNIAISDHIHSRQVVKGF